MAEIITAVDKVGAQEWRYRWSGTGPYDVWTNGQLLFAATTLEELVLRNESPMTLGVIPTPPAAVTEPDAIEVIDLATETSAADAQSSLYPPYAILQWRGVAGVDHYRIEAFEDAAWVQKRRINETGNGYYMLKTRPLADDTTHQWRVIAVDARGYESTAVQLDIFMVRNPAPPDITITYDSGTGRVTIADA